MKTGRFNRRAFLKSTVASSAAAVSAGLPQTPEARQKTGAQPAPGAGYAYLNAEAATATTPTGSCPVFRA